MRLKKIKDQIDAKIQEIEANQKETARLKELTREELEKLKKQVDDLNA